MEPATGMHRQWSRLVDNHQGFIFVDQPNGAGHRRFDVTAFNLFELLAFANQLIGRYNVCHRR